MRKVRIAIVQFAPRPTEVAANRAAIVERLHKAGEAGADLVLLPELATTGYACGDAFLDIAETVPGPTTQEWGKLARRYGYHIIGGMARRDDRLSSVVYNAAVLIDPRGEVAGTYAKVILPLYLNTWLAEDGQPMMVQEAEVFRRGDRLVVWDTPLGRIGIMICQDSVYPELIRVLALKGAELIVQIQNSPAMATQHEEDITALTTRVHAFDTGVFIAFANRYGTEHFSYMGRERSVTFYGASHICDPLGNWVAKAPAEEEALLVADIDLDQVRQAQWALKFIRDWRPELLEPLTRRDVTLSSD